MNVCCIVIFVVFFTFVLVGWAQGMLRLVISVAGLIASIAISLYGAPYVSGYLQEHTQIDDKMAASISSQLAYSDGGEEVTRGIQIAAINALPLPESVKSSILNNNNSEMYQLLEVSGVYDYIAMSIAVVILNGVVFLAMLILCRIVFMILGHRSKNLTKIPIVRSLDKIGGGVLGGIRGVLWLCVFFLLLSITSTFQWSSEIIRQISEVRILKFLYDNNVLVELVSDLTKILFF